jgi:hypothetical protein
LPQIKKRSHQKKHFAAERVTPKSQIEPLYKFFGSIPIGPTDHQTPLQWGITIHLTFMFRNLEFILSFNV